MQPPDNVFNQPARTNISNGRRQTWHQQGLSDAVDDGETSKLIIRRRSRTAIDARDYLGPLGVPFVGLPPVGSARRLINEFGARFVFTIFYYQHVMRGCVLELRNAAIMFIFREYHTPPDLIAVYGSLELLPWCMKSIIGLTSDLFPILGYNKAPYIILSCALGTAAMFAVGLMTTEQMPLALFVACLFLSTLQIVVADVLLQGAYSRKVQACRTPEVRTQFISFVWFGIDAGMIIASVASGFIMKYTTHRMVFFICGFPAALAFAIPFFGFLGEKQAIPEEVTQRRQLFYEQKEVCLLCCVIFVASVCMTIPTISNAPPTTIGVLSLVLAFVVLSGVSLFMTPPIAKMGAFILITKMFSLNVGAAAFYFYTDNPQSYPDGPHLSTFFFTTVNKTVEAVSALIGIGLFQLAAKNWTYRNWLTLMIILFDIFSALYTIQFLRWNVSIKIPDWIFLLFTTVVTSMVGQMQLMPLIVSFSYLSPKGMEATCFAAFTGVLNMAIMTSGNLSGWLIHIIGCKPAGHLNEGAQFKYLWLGSLWFVFHFPIFLCCRRLLPNEFMNKTLVIDYDATSDSLWHRLWHGCSETDANGGNKA